MGKHKTYNLTQKLRAAAAILMVSSLGLFYPGTVSSGQSPVKATSSSPSGGPREGIKVHGHWTIVIRNPDDKLVARHEFKNALTQFGSQILSGFLRGQFRPGEWAIRLSSDGGGNEPCLGSVTQQPCLIYEATSQHANSSFPNSFKTLTISTNSPFFNHTNLNGTATAQRNGVISHVATLLESCPPEGCDHFGHGAFTQTQIPSPINVVAGQIIQVTVVISFS